MEHLLTLFIIFTQVVHISVDIIYKLNFSLAFYYLLKDLFVKFLIILKQIIKILVFV